MCLYDEPNIFFSQFSDLVSTFIDGLVAFYFARKHRSDEAKWRAIGEDIMVRGTAIASIFGTASNSSKSEQYCNRFS